MPSVSSIVGGSFGFARAHVGIIAVWCLVYMAGGLVMVMVMSPADWGAMAMPSGEPRLPPGFFGKLMGGYAVMIVMLIALYAAVFRAILKPEEGRAAYLRLGGDELRLFGLSVILVVGTYVAMLVVGVVLMILASVVLAMAGAENASAATIIAIAFPLAFLICGGSIWLMVRLSPAGPLTILRGKIIIGDAWRLTRGHFWALFGGYLVVTLIVFAVLLAFFGLAMGSYFTALAHAMGDPAAMQAVAREEIGRMAPGSARWFVMFLPGGVLGGVAIALHGGMAAIATRDLLTTREVPPPLA